MKIKNTQFMAGLAAFLAGSLNVNSSFAVGGGCNTSQTGFTNGNNATSLYANTGLGIAHQLITMLNNGFGNIPADVMCHFTNDMGMPTTGIHLPFDTTKTFNGHNVELTVTVPNESFATLNGYAAKAVVTYDGVVFMNLWWGGGGASSKGFLISHSNGFNPNSAMYLQYDLTDPSKQIIKVWASQATTPSTILNTSGDMVMYGRIIYNSTTGAITDQALRVYNHSGTIQCDRGSIASGSTLGTNLIFDFNTNGTPLTSGSPGWSTKDSTGLSGASFIDSTSTASGTSVPASVTLDFGCSDLDGAIGAAGILAAGDVSDSVLPSTVFPK